jgi:hypothetical protein
VVRSQLERLWQVIDGPAGDAVIATLRRLSRLSPAAQRRIVELASAAPTPDAPASASIPDVAQWILGHVLARGVALPGLRHADLFAAVAELLGYDEELAAVMDRSRDWRATGANDRRLDQRKIMTRRSRLNARRRKAGYVV